MQGEYTGLYRGRVIKNDDSNEDKPYYGKIKINVPQIYGEGINENDLPWAYPLIPFGQGKDNDDFDYCSLNIPREDTWVWVLFEYGDHERPVYVGGWIGGKESELPEDFKEDGRSDTVYPDIQGYKFGFDGGSFSVRVVDDRRLEVYFDENNIIEIDSQGDSPNEEKQISIRSEWLIRAKSDTEIKLQAPVITIEAGSELSVLSEGTSELGGTGSTTVKGSVIKGEGTVKGQFHHPKS